MAAPTVNRALFALIVAFVLLSGTASAFSFQDIIDYILSLFGGSNTVVTQTCPPGYIPSGDICCLDRNGNGVCDAYESTTTQAPTTTIAAQMPTSSTHAPLPTATTASTTTTIAQSTTTTAALRTTTTSVNAQPTSTTQRATTTTESSSRTTVTTSTQPVVSGPVCGNGVFEQGEECEKATNCGDFHKCVGCKCITDCDSFCGAQGQGYASFAGAATLDACKAKAADVRGANEACYYKCSMAKFFKGFTDTCCCVKAGKLPCGNCPCTGEGCKVSCPTEVECEAAI